jgi:glycosyltransferase involved in cell wall biosynthesis
MVGRLAPWKGHHVFLEAFAKAFPDGEERAVIVGSAMFGEDAYATEVAAHIDRLGLVDRVELTGFVDDVHRVLVEASCLVHASVTPEPFGQVVVEGMAAGLPVIASDAGGPAEVVTDGVDGLLFPPGDSLELARLLNRLADSEELRSSLAAAGRRTATRYAAAGIAGEVESFYARVLRSTRRRRW